MAGIIEETETGYKFSYDLNYLSDENNKPISMDAKQRSNIKPELEVAIVLKHDQRTGKLTYGVVKDILTNSKFHPHGIKVRLQTGEVGRVKEIIKNEIE